MTEPKLTVNSEKEISFDAPGIGEPVLDIASTTMLPEEKIKEEILQKSPKEIVDSIWAMPKVKEQTATRPIARSAATAEIPKMAVEREMTRPAFEPVEEMPEVKKIGKEAARIKTGIDFNADDPGDFSSIEKTLEQSF